MAKTTKDLHQVLSEIQVQLNAPKAQYNSFGKYSYRSCEDILNALKPYLEANECIITITDKLVVKGLRYYVKATATLSIHKQHISTNAYAREPELKKGMDEAQITGATSSYARKYALNGLFAIDDTKDADTQKPQPATVAPARVTKKKVDDESFERLTSLPKDEATQHIKSGVYDFTAEQVAELAKKGLK